MSSVDPTSDISHTSHIGNTDSATKWLREPLLHFILLGALLFAVDHYLISQKDDPGTIVVTTEIDDDIEGAFEEARGHEPSLEELTALQRLWLDNELLYREGLSMQLDKGDDAIRQRVIFKALSVIEASLKLPEYDDNVLRKWFEARRDKYDEPARYDFQEAVLSGEKSEVEVKTFVNTLNREAPGDTGAGLRVFKGRPQENLEQSYGAEFIKVLETAQSGDWHALPTKNGWRAIRLDARTPAKPADFETLRGVILQDWTDATMAELRTAAVRALADKYQIKFEVVSE